jgi:hypothetical protein
MFINNFLLVLMLFTMVVIKRFAIAFAKAIEFFQWVLHFFCSGLGFFCCSLIMAFDFFLQKKAQAILSK